MTGAAVYDIWKREFPVSVQILLLGMYAIQFNTADLWGAVFAIPFFIAAIFSNKMGMGDAKAVLLLGGLSGICKMYLTVVISSLGFIIFSFVKGKQNKLYPYIPFLTAGYLITEILEVMLI